MVLKLNLKHKSSFVSPSCEPREAVGMNYQRKGETAAFGSTHVGPRWFWGDENTV